MRIEEGGGDADEPQAPSDRPDEDDEAREKVIVRSNGVVTYVGKDIANQFWKFGLLGRDFRYRRFADAGRRPAAVVDDVRRRATRARRRSATPSGSTTSSTRGRCTCRRCSARRCGRSAIRGKPRTRFTSRTRWSRCRTRRRASSATRPAGGRGREEAVRRGVGPQGARRQDRRSARSADREGRRRSREAESGVLGRRVPARRRRRLRSARSATSC